MHERLSVHSICFGNASLGELAGCWDALGVRRVSLSSAQLPDGDLAPARDLLAAGGYQLETITHPFLAGRALESREESWREARAALARTIDVAAGLGARSIYMLTGGHGDLTWEQAAQAFTAALAPCVAQARDAGVVLMIENAPWLYADLHIAHSLRDTVTLAEMADIGVCIDLYSCWTEAGLRTSIERAMPRCHLVQVGDYVYGDRALPARAVPGDGAIPLRTILSWILAGGYAGIFELELLGPRIDREGHLAAARRAAQYMSAMLEALGA